MATVYVVMGVSGAGKTRIASALATALHADFVEGDEYHPTENVERMSRGIALTDDDRAAWLDALATRIREATRAQTPMVMTCSALKRAYRDRLRAAGDVQFVYVRGSRALIAARLAKRRGHFMPATLLDSQFSTLEEPSADEQVWVCDATESPESIVDELVARVRAAK